MMPDGARKQRLAPRLIESLERLFGESILPFDRQAAIVFAHSNAQTRRKGRVLAYADCQITAIAKSRGFSVATRDVAPVRDAGIAVVNPWTEE